jgi:hypothetical protein
MKRLLTTVGLMAVLVANLSASQGPDIKVINDKVSIQAEGVPLARLLRLLGEATGMDAKVPPELANRNVSVRFSNLGFTEAVQKIFEGQPLDYVLIEGKSITVTGQAQANTAAAAGAGPRSNGVPFNAPQEPAFNDDNPPFGPPQQMLNQQNPPPMIQTPFGAIPNPNAQNAPAQNQPAMIQTPFGAIPNPNVQRQQQQPGMQPLVNPAQQQPNPFNSNLPGLNTTPGAPAQNINPFGGQSYPYPQPNVISPNGNPVVTPNAPAGMPVSPIGTPFPGPTPQQQRPPNP